MLVTKASKKCQNHPSAEGDVIPEKGQLIVDEKKIKSFSVADNFANKAPPFNKEGPLLNPGALKRPELLNTLLELLTKLNWILENTSRTNIL